MKSPAELTEIFRSRGLKVTPQRQCIFRVLHSSGVHPTAEAVYAAAASEMPTISLKTVYQTLHDLAGMGEIQQIDLGTGSSRFDPNTDGHHHFVCNRCGLVRDLYVNPRVRLPAGELDGFTIDSTEVVLRGLCDACAGATTSGAVPVPPVPPNNEETLHA